MSNLVFTLEETENSRLKHSRSLTLDCETLKTFPDVYLQLVMQKNRNLRPSRPAASNYSLAPSLKLEISLKN